MSNQLQPRAYGVDLLGERTKSKEHQPKGHQSKDLEPDFIANSATTNWELSEEFNVEHTRFFTQI